jgi:hypothetical protein
MSPVLSSLIPFLAYAAVIALIAYKAWTLWLGRQSRDWPHVTGKVVVARIVRGESRDHSGDSVGSHRHRTEYFQLEVRYEYRVRGKAYVGTKHSFRVNRYDEYGDAVDALRGIVAGHEVPVYYDPRQPQRAVLING